MIDWTIHIKITLRGNNKNFISQATAKDWLSSAYLFAGVSGDKASYIASHFGGSGDGIESDGVEGLVVMLSNHQCTLQPRTDTLMMQKKKNSITYC